MRLSSLVIVLGCLPIGAKSIAEEKSDSQSKPLLTLYGRNSKISERTFFRITTADEWWAMWLQHKTGSAKPKNVPGDLESVELDFDEVMAIAVFEGESINCRGYTADSISVSEKQILIRLDAHSYQSGVRTPDTQAWGILVLPKSCKEVVLQCDRRGGKDDPPDWRDWARFPALKQSKK